jgi:hypothetical protein
MQVKQLLKEYYDNGGKVNESDIAQIIFEEKGKYNARALFSFLKNERYDKVNISPVYIHRLCDFFKCDPNKIFK